MKQLVLPVFLSLGVAFGALGCELLTKERKRVENLLASAQSAAASAAPAPTTIAPVATPTTAGIADDQIPAPEDFEQQAAREITPEKMQAELDRLKKDIGP